MEMSPLFYVHLMVICVGLIPDCEACYSSTNGVYCYTTGAIVGISISCIVAVGIAIAIMVMLCLRRKSSPGAVIVQNQPPPATTVITHSNNGFVSTVGHSPPPYTGVAVTPVVGQTVSHPIAPYVVHAPPPYPGVAVTPVVSQTVSQPIIPAQTVVQPVRAPASSLATNARTVLGVANAISNVTDLFSGMVEASAPGEM